MTADLDGRVCLFRRLGGLPCWSDYESRPISESVDFSSPVLVGSYQHKDWVRCLAEIDGIVVSCCKTGEVRCAFVESSALEGQLDTALDATALKDRQTTPEALVVQSAWHVNRPDNVWRIAR